MKITSDIIWAVVLLVVAAASFLIGRKKESLKTEELLNEKLEEIKVLENKNQQLSEELTSRGIYSYPQANIISKKKDSVAMVLISLNGKDPIENLKLRRNVLADYSTALSSTPERKGKLTDLGTLKPHNPSAFDIPLEGEEIALQLDFESKKNKWKQYVWIKKSEDGKIKSFWVITNENSVVVDKHIDPGFPLDTEEKVVLSNGQSLDYSELKMNSIFPPNN